MTDSFQNRAVTIFPDIAEIEFKSINSKYLNVILIQVLLFFLLVFAGVFLAEHYNLFMLLENPFWVFLGISIIFVGILALRVVGFKKRNYAVREKDVSYKKGVFFKSLTTVPFNRIQHIEIDEGPISRLFNLVSLSVFTAGDSSDDLKISGLLKEEAKQIKEFISTKIDG